MNPRPIYVTVIGWLYIITGVVGGVYHARGFRAHPFAFDPVPGEFVCLAAIVAGAYVLRGRNWARWLVLGWMAFHVVLTAFYSATEMAIHALFLAILAVLLFRPAASRYFQTAGE